MKLKFCICLFFLTKSCSADTTFSLAEKIEHYPTFINNLRGKVHDFLKMQQINMDLDIEDRYARNLIQQANYFEDHERDNYETMDDIFTAAFERLDSKLIETAKLLDTTSSPNKVKVSFIRSLKDDATASINALIKRYSKKRQKR